MKFLIRKMRFDIRLRLISLLLLTGVVGLLLTGGLAYRHEVRSVDERTRARLESISRLRASQIETYVSNHLSQIQAISAGTLMPMAQQAFAEAFARLGEHPLSPEENSALARHYETEVLPATKGMPALEQTHRFRHPQNPAAARLQLRYCAGAASQAGPKDDYARAFEKFDPDIRKMMGPLDYYDLLFIDGDGDRIIYSLRYEHDLGTSLRSNTYADTPLASAVRRLHESGEDRVVVTDLHRYWASFGTPSAFFIAPLYAEGRKTGYLAVQIGGKHINDLLSAYGNREAEGLGRSGETLAVGSDYTLRNDMREHTESPEKFLARFAKTPETAPLLDHAGKSGSTVLNIPLVLEQRRLALSGKSGYGEFDDMRGVPCFVAYRPVDFGGTRWALVSKIDRAEALAPLREFLRTMLLGGAITLTLLALVSLRLAHSFTGPIRTLIASAEKIAAGDERMTVHLDTGDEFEDMADSLNTMLATLRKKTAEIEEKTRMKSRFLANMSHEIRTPMNAILGYAQLLSRSPAIPPAEKEQIATINRAGDHLIAIINDILEMSKIESGRATYNPEDGSLRQLLDSIVTTYGRKAHDKGVAMTASLDPRMEGCVRTDFGKLRQIVINLVGNAVKFTERGEIIVTAKSTREPTGGFTLEIVVQDTGAGIAESDLGKIFRPFSQVESGKLAGGTGLGLAISENFARLLGGAITVKSAPGQGSTFTLTTHADACINDSPRVTRDPRRPARLLESSRPVSVLIVDDMSLNRRLLESILRPVEFELSFAENGREAVEAFRDRKPHAILLDMIMPEMDGMEATRAIRAMEGGDKVLIIMITASVFDSDRAAVLSAGADGFVKKPFDQIELLHLLGDHLSLQYEYDPEPERPAEDAAAPAKLPESLRESLLHAVEAADFEAVQALLGEVAGHSRPLAESVKEKLGRYDYDGLRRLIAAA